MLIKKACWDKPGDKTSTKFNWSLNIVHISLGREMQGEAPCSHTQARQYCVSDPDSPRVPPSPRPFEYSDLQKQPSVFPSYQDTFTNCFRFPCIWNNPGNISCTDFRITFSFLAPPVNCSGSPQLNFYSTALKDSTAECPAHNVLTGHEHGRHGCRITVNHSGTLSCELVICWQLCFTRADINLRWHQLRNKANADSKCVTTEECCPFVMDTVALFMLKTISFWWKLTLLSYQKSGHGIHIK